jgi:hypothetical protein
MQTQSAAVRGEASPKILWKWTGISAVLHALLIASLCGVSYWGFHQRELASKAKAEADEIAAQKAEAAEAAKSPAPSATPAATQSPAPTTDEDSKPPVQAEKVLGIDKTAKPEELPGSPFASKNDDLLKDLK